jgi:CDP-6-deoxy-D-xylo-4-hexulose-3-dehydrase
VTLVLPGSPPAVYRYPLARVTYGEEEIAAVERTLRAGRTTMGPQVEAFEAGFASLVGAQEAVMVNSGSSADLLAAFALGPPLRGLDEILIPAVTWPTQVWACLMAGYRVRLVDVDPATLQMDPVDLDRKRTWRTRAVFATHVLGACGSMDVLAGLCASHELDLIEDCCEALGTRWKGRHVGTFGTAGAFSFFFSHVLSTMEGGMVVTDDPGTARFLRLWRNHGWEPQPGQHFAFPTWGMNLRPTEVQGAFGKVQLGKLYAFQAWREHNHVMLLDEVRRYAGLLETVKVVPGCVPAWHAFPLTVREDAGFTKHELCAYLEQRGVETRPLIAGNLARQPALQEEWRVLSGDLPGADAVHERAFYIGLASEDDPEGTGYVGECVRDFIEKGERA